MSRFGLRSHADGFKLSENGRESKKVFKSQNILSKRGHQKRKNTSDKNEKITSDKMEPSTEATDTGDHISPISIVCSLPLYKISGILEKIGSPSFKSQNNDGNSKIAKQSSDQQRNDHSNPLHMKILCLYCDKKFSSQTMQIKHVEKMHILSKDRRCSSRNTHSFESKQPTVISSSPTPQNFIGCSYCKNTKGHIAAPANDLMDLFIHSIDHHSDKYFGCKLCILRFQNQSKLSKHMQSIHKDFSFQTDEHFSSKEEALSPLVCDTDKLKTCKNHVQKTVTNQRSPSSLSQNSALSSLGCPSETKNSMFSGDEPILSRLGVAQNRLPSNRRGLRLRRDVVITDILFKSDQSANIAKNRNKVGKPLSSADYSDVVFRVPTRTDIMSCTFDDDFYENVVLNVRNNLLYHLDGKMLEHMPAPHTSIAVKKSSYSRSTLVKSPIISSSEIHAATNISTTTAFPTLLTAEQYGGDVTTKIKRSITKHSWKWKWDSFKKFKLVNEGGKIIKKMKQPILSLRDLSKLDMWTQLTMRQKNDILKNIPSASVSSLCGREEKQRLKDQLNSILDTRLLPHIILEQSEQTIIKFESEDDDICVVGQYSHKPMGVPQYDDRFFSVLNLIPSNNKCIRNQHIILSGEWARPRCYLCIGCGSKFEKLKSLEEHKMFRHSHVYSTHYEIVGRELLASNLLKHFFIPKRALNRYESERITCPLQKCIANRSEISGRNIINITPEESSDSIQSILNSFTTTHSSKISTDECDNDTKMIMHVNALSPTHSLQSASTSVSTPVSQLKPNKESDRAVSCTKCNRRCSGILDLYRHMLDCSGDYIWNMAKKRKYRYYCGSKKRRQCNKYSNADLKRKKTTSVKENTTFEVENSQKTKTPPRQRPSDAESIKKMLENLPPKRVCKKILPILNKTRKSRLMAKRKIFNSQVIKQKRSMRKGQTNILPKSKCQILTTVNQSSGSDQKETVTNEEEAQEVTEILSLEDSKDIDSHNIQKDVLTKAIEENSRSKMFIESKNKRTESVEKLENNIITSDNTAASSKTDNILEETHQTPSPNNNSIPNNDNSNHINNIHVSSIECQNNDILPKDSTTEAFPSSAGYDHSKKKRSKKINDCIAMLTGKLEEKLKTEKSVEHKTSNIVNDSECKQNSSNVNKTTKRKTCSRKIVKLDLVGNEANQIPPTQVPKQSFVNQIMPTSSITEKVVIEHNRKESVPSVVQTVVASNIFPTIPVNISTQNKFIPSEKLPVKSSTISKEIQLPPSITTQYSLVPVSPQSAKVSTVCVPVVNLALPIIRHSIPTRRQTICGLERSHFANTLIDNMEPLDLSKKPQNIHKPQVEKTVEISSIPIINCQINNAEPIVTPIQIPIAQAKPFYSNLELLKIPQIRNVPCLNVVDEKVSYQKILPKRRATNKGLTETQNACPISSCYPKVSFNVRDPIVNKRDNVPKCKYIPKMDEVVINHIDDAINSVINAAELSTPETEAPNTQVDNDNDNEKKTTNLSLEREPIAKSKLETQREELTPLKRSVRSKTLDCAFFEASEINNSPLFAQIQIPLEEEISSKIQEKIPKVPVTPEKVDTSTEYASNTICLNNQPNTPVKDTVSVSVVPAKIDDQTTVLKSHDQVITENSIDERGLLEKLNNDQPLNHVKKQRRRRKNELAAIVADQLLESFKIDKARRDNLKKLENLAYEKSDDLLITGMLLMSSTKRKTSASITSCPGVNAKSVDSNLEIKKRQKQDQSLKNVKTNNRAIESIDTQKMDKSDVINTPECAFEKDYDLRKCKRKQIRKRGKSVENENINKLKTSLESFTLGIDTTKQSSDVVSKSTNIYNPSADSCNLAASASKNSTILRPSILSVTLEPPNVVSGQAGDGKTVVSSRDPRLNKNIHKDENAVEGRGSLSKHRLRSANNGDLDGKKLDEICDIEEDNYLTEIAKNVNEKIMSAENEEFVFANDEFEVGSIMQDESSTKFYRPSTSMSVRSAPNLNDEHSNFGSMDENTNTEIIDMDLDDNISVYTSFSQDVNRGRRRRRRRRSILLSRKPKKRFSRDLAEEKFECDLCKKTFFAASSLSKHQTTLAHVSKVSEQEYLLSKSKTNPIIATENSAIPENKAEDIVTEAIPNQTCKKNSTEVSAIRENEHEIEENKEKSGYNSFARLTLNPDERLFFECCNILKGTQTARMNEVDSVNCTKYTYAYQEKNETPNDNHKKTSQPVVKQTVPEKLNSEIPSQSAQHYVFRDPPIVNIVSNKVTPDYSYPTNEQHNSATSHISAMTNTTSRFKTKAAMKGYENITSEYNIQHNNETKSKSVCKLTALAEIALGNENTSSPKLLMEHKESHSFVQLNSTEGDIVTINDSAKGSNIHDNKEYKKNDTHSTSSKTIMHLSVLKTAEEVHVIKTQADKIVIPDRPFKNIGLEEKETIKFQKPKSTVNLLNTDDNSVSTISYSDRDDFDFGSISCDEDISNKNINGKSDKNDCSNSSSSRLTTKTFENKSLIMGRIFKNATAKNKTHKKVKSVGVQKNPSPRTDLNQIFDELRGNSVVKISLDGSNKRLFETASATAEKDNNVKYTSIMSNASTRNNNRKNSSKLESELGMSSEEIAKLIDEGQRKSKRRCATNRPKKLVEMWSSDEYEEFLSTKDIFALIEEKEKEEKKRKRKSSTTIPTTAEDKDSSAIGSNKSCTLRRTSKSKEVVEKKPMVKSKLSQRKEVETNHHIKQMKKVNAFDGISVSKKSQATSRQSLIEEIKKSGNKAKQLERGATRCNGTDRKNIRTSKNAEREFSEKQPICNKVKKCSRKSQTVSSSFPRRKRLASEKLYYWSSSSDEEFGRINTSNVQDFESGEQYQKHGWIVGDSHKKLVTLLAIAKGNKKVDKCSVKKETSKKRI